MDSLQCRLYPPLKGPLFLKNPPFRTPDHPSIILRASFCIGVGVLVAAVYFPHSVTIRASGFSRTYIYICIYTYRARNNTSFVDCCWVGALSKVAARYRPAFFERYGVFAVETPYGWLSELWSLFGYPKY